jgi:hypothetical protein
VSHHPAETECRFQQLCEYVPYLPPLPELVKRPPTQTNLLLLHLVAYLSAVTNIDTPLLHHLSKSITRKCNLVHLAQPSSLVAVQAFELLATFAPLGVLPCQPVAPSNLVVARGYLLTARSIAQSIDLATTGQLDSLDPQSESVWTWLSLAVSEASMVLEDHLPTRCMILEECQEIAEGLFGCLYGLDGYEAKLWICERVSRLSIVFSALASMYQAINTCDDLFGCSHLDICTALTVAQSQFAAVQDKYEGLYTSQSPTRTIYRLYYEGKVQRNANIHLIATAYLPGSITAFPDLPNVLPYIPLDPLSNQRNRFTLAFTAACTPSNIGRWFAHHRGTFLGDTLLSWAQSRGQGLEEMLIALTALDRAHLAPWHHLICLAVDGSNVIMELQAASMVIAETVVSLRQDLRMTQRSYMMRQVAATIRGLEGGEGGTFGVMCGNLIGSMAQRTEDRTEKVSIEVGRRRSQAAASESAGSEVSPTGIGSITAALFEFEDESLRPNATLDDWSSCL